MSKDILTTTGLIEEATNTLRGARISKGIMIENYFARRKFEQIIDPSRKLWEGTSDTKGSNPFIDLWINNLLIDYQEVVNQRPGIEGSVRTVAERTKDTIRKDLLETAEQYTNLQFNEDEDPTIVTGDPLERSAILEAARFLGYKIAEDENGCKRIGTSRRHNANIESLIETRINVGVINIMYDFEDFKGEPLSRPTVRQIVAMTDHMAKSLRQSQKQ
jgi:hypothetical protein